jgi:ATP-binding cassette subfamily B protein AbcA/BmrA
MIVNGKHEQKLDKKPKLLGIFIRLLKLSKAYWTWYVSLVAITILLSLLITVNAELMRQVVNAIVDRDMSMLLTASIGLAIIVAIEFVGNLSNSYLQTRLNNKSTYGLQQLVLEKIFRLRAKDIAAYHTGDLISRIQDASPDAQSAMNGKMIQIIGNVFQLIFLLSYLSVVNFSLTLGSLIITLVIPLFANPISKQMRDTYMKRQVARAQQDAYLMDSMQGMEVVKSYASLDKVTTTFRDKWNHYLKPHLKALKLEAVFYRVNILVSVVGLMYILGFGGYLITQGKLDVGALAAFLIAFQGLSGPISNLTSLWPQLQGAIASALRVFEIIDLPEETDMAENIAASPAAHPFTFGDVEFRDVRFQYRLESKSVLNNVNFTIKEGQMTALIGESGSGKSTIAKLLLGFYNPDSGAILARGKPLTDIELASWRNCISYVSQDPYLFSGTIGENILLGKPDASEQEMVEAAIVANIHDWIEQLPRGYDTAVGEKGLLLSGGQRQRISIARAMLKQPKLLVLDEPTSALDGENERIVSEALENVMTGRTVVIIAHRLSTVRKANRIIVMQQGSVREEGTHDELMENSGLYQSMCAMDSLDRRGETA